jgi:hypothetical protein
MKNTMNRPVCHLGVKARHLMAVMAHLFLLHSVLETLGYPLQGRPMDKPVMVLKVPPLLLRRLPIVSLAVILGYPPQLRPMDKPPIAPKALPGSPFPLPTIGCQRDLHLLHVHYLTQAFPLPKRPTLMSMTEDSITESKGAMLVFLVL